MHTLRRQLLSLALSSAKGAAAGGGRTSSRLYAAVNPQADTRKWLQRAQMIDKRGHSNLMLLGTVRLQHQKAAPISEEIQAQEETSSETLEEKVKNVSDEDVAKFFREHQIHVQGLQDPKIQKPILDFSQIQFPPKLQELMNQYKYSTPTPIQAQSLPILLSGRDLIGNYHNTFSEH